MIAALEVLVTLIVIVVLLQRKVKMGNAMLAGAAVLFLVSGPEMQKLTAAVMATLTSHSTWEIVVALYFVMCLEYQLRVHGIIDGFMNVSRSIVKSDRILLAMMPAFLGFLPSLGGAIFSAPLVENAAKPYNLSPETKTTINYWFRHVWEFTNPIFTGMLLASKISDIPLSALISHMAWLTVLAIMIGWLAFIAPLKDTHITATGSNQEFKTPKEYRYIALASGPILANLLLVVGFKLDASISMGLVVFAMIFILCQGAGDIRLMLLHAFDRRLLWGVISILFFQHILRQSGVIIDIAALLNSLSIPPHVIIGIIAFAGGILTGTSQGFVALAFPFIAILSPGDLNLVTLCFVMGTAGHMLSPAHLCLLVTLDYFKSGFMRTLKPVAVLEVIMAVTAYGVVGVIG